MARQDYSHRHDRLVVILSFLFIASLLYSVYVLSVTMFLFGLISLLKFDDKNSWPRFRSDFIEQVGELLNRPAWWLISLSFFIVLFGGLYSDDTSYWFARLRIKAPFLFLPIAFYLIPAISKKTYLQVHLIFLLLISLSTLPIIWHIILNYSEVVQSIQHGRPVNTPISHIRYSLLVALAIASSFLLSRTRFQSLVPTRWMIGLLLYFILFIHVLAVRSGLVAFYGMAFLYILVGLFRSQKVVSTMILLGVIILMPMLAYQNIPSFKQRILYMVEDAAKYQDEQWNAYSDAERLLSLRAGLQIWSRQPIFGVGSGDLKEEMRVYFYRAYDKDTYIMPHNQFISILAGTGLVGCLLFIIALFTPLLIGHAYRNPFFLALHVIVIISLMVENTFETSVGVAFYLFFCLLGLNHLKQGTSALLQPNNSSLS